MNDLEEIIMRKVRYKKGFSESEYTGEGWFHQFICYPGNITNVIIELNDGTRLRKIIVNLGRKSKRFHQSLQNISKSLARRSVSHNICQCATVRKL